MERMRILTGGEIEVVKVYEDWEKTLIGNYWNAVRVFLEGDEEALDPYIGVFVGEWELETDLDVIEDLANDGELEQLEIYES